MEQFNRRWGTHKGEASLVEFLTLAHEAGKRVFDQSFARLAEQVGLLLATAWHKRRFTKRLFTLAHEAGKRTFDQSFPRLAEQV